MRFALYDVCVNILLLILICNGEIMKLNQTAARTLLGLLIGCGVMNTANATLLNGQTVSFQYLFPTISSDYSSTANGNYVVGSGVEVLNGVCCSFEGTVDISDNNIRVNFHGNGGYSSAAFNGFLISDVLGQIGDFTSVSVNGATNMGGFDISDVTFDANHIWVNWQGLNFAPGVVVSVDINGNSSDVPEPASLALIGLGFAGLGVARAFKRV